MDDSGGKNSPIGLSTAGNKEGYIQTPGIQQQVYWRYTSKHQVYNNRYTGGIHPDTMQARKQQILTQSIDLTLHHKMAESRLCIDLLVSGRKRTPIYS